MNETIITQLGNAETMEEYTCYTVDSDGDFLTVAMQNNTIIGVFKHIQCHDRFYCDTLYGDDDLNEEIAEQIDRMFMEEAEQ